ncbi:hypothetical protein EON65_11510 [archaeon]|nr:MAG: hypothetical protein EON65_11510 [archaeon]
MVELLEVEAIGHGVVTNKVLVPHEPSAVLNLGHLQQSTTDVDVIMGTIMTCSCYSMMIGSASGSVHVEEAEVR